EKQVCFALHKLWMLDFILKFYGSIFQKLEECLIEGGGSNRIIIRSIQADLQKNSFKRTFPILLIGLQTA
ncbi:22451_t:CDS:1, partial [Rhizophagus irregularis]